MVKHPSLGISSGHNVLQGMDAHHCGASSGECQVTLFFIYFYFFFSGYFTTAAFHTFKAAAATQKSVHFGNPLLKSLQHSMVPSL